jgi:hypothetical protein
MSTEDYQVFKYSPAKLSAIKGLLDSESMIILKTYLKSLEKEINTQTVAKVAWMTNSYISYLAKYSHNLLQFSEPKFMDILLSDLNFKRVFEKYVFHYEDTTIPPLQPTVFEMVRTKLYPKIEGKVNINRTLTSFDIENLFAPVEVNFIGINGIPVAGQTVDFEKKHYYLENDITRFISLTKALELSGKKDGKYFILGKEPARNKTKKNHLLWELINDSDFLDFVDVDEVDIVESYVNLNQVTPFFKD